MTVDSHRQTVTIKNPQGFHMRPMATFVETANRYPGNVIVSRPDIDSCANGKSILALMGLVAVQGTELQIEVTGPDASDMLRTLVELLERNFDEEHEPARH